MKLDLEQFSVAVAEHFAGTDAPLGIQAQAAIAECRAQRERIAELEAALDVIAEGHVMQGSYMLADIIVKYQQIARAALASVRP